MTNTVYLSIYRYKNLPTRTPVTHPARDYDGALSVGPPTHTTAAAAAAATLAVS